MVIIALIKTDFTEPVVPAIRAWGILSSGSQSDNRAVESGAARAHKARMNDAPPAEALRRAGRGAITKVLNFEFLVVSSQLKIQHAPLKTQRSALFSRAPGLTARLSVGALVGLIRRVMERGRRWKGLSR